MGVSYQEKERGIGNGDGGCAIRRGLRWDRSERE
jgi:hypothetical protein